MSLEGRHILLGITGSIAAYKAAILCRLLKGAGAEVKVVMTPLAKQFITPLTMATLSKHPILVEFFNPENGEWNSHVSLLTTYLSARCPVAVAPAMDLDMFAHSATQENLRILRSRGVRIVEPAEGELASGLSGKGRMAEPADIVAFVEDLLSEKRLIVTAGATIEAIDPVRFISNHSTGKMGYAIAEALARRGAEVVLISGRTSLPTPTGVRRIDVLSAQEMYEASVREFATADGAVMCAAVADYTPEEVAPTKLKKGDGELTIRLKRTHDIAAELGAHKAGRILVGFALETDHEEANAEGKLQRKNFDFIVLNSLRDAGAGFGVDTNKVTLIDRAGREELPLLSKAETAEKIADKIESILK